VTGRGLDLDAHALASVRRDVATETWPSSCSVAVTTPTASSMRVLARLDLRPTVRERDDQADRAVAAHAEVTHVVEEDHARGAARVGGRQEQPADEHVRAARLVHDRGAEGVVLFAEEGQALGEGSAAQVGGRPPDDDPCGLAARVRVDDVHTASSGGAPASVVAGRFLMRRWMTFRMASRSAPASGRRGGADGFGAQATLLNRELDVLHELRVRVQVQQRHVPAVDRARFVPLAGHREVVEVLIFGGKAQQRPAIQPTAPSMRLSSARSSTPVKIA
jgi:hypothetical protein